MRLNSLDQALKIIEVLKVRKSTVKELAKETGINLRMVYRLLDVISLHLNVTEENVPGKNGNVFKIVE